MDLSYSGHFLAMFLLAVMAGCGEDTGGVHYATASGVVSLKGAPLSGARVMAVPENGPLAMGNTDTSGKFTLHSGTRPGVAIGKIRVSVVVAEPESNSVATPSTGDNDPSNVVNSTQSMATLVEAQKKKNKKPQTQSPSALAKYADPATSGLNFEIKSGSNDLPIKLE